LSYASESGHYKPIHTTNQEKNSTSLLFSSDLESYEYTDRNLYWSIGVSIIYDFRLLIADCR